MMSVKKVPCIGSLQIKEEGNEGDDKIQNMELASCGEGYEDLYFDTGRFAMKLDWLEWCQDCTGWSIVADSTDTFFQSNPFVEMGSVAEADQGDNKNFYVVGEWSVICDHWFVKVFI